MECAWSTRSSIELTFCVMSNGFGAVTDGFDERAQGGCRLKRSQRLAGFYDEDHAPDAVGLSAFDDLERGRAVEGVVGGFEPLADVAGFHDFGEGLEEALHFLKPTPGGSSGLVPGGPLVDRAKGVTGHPGKVRTDQLVAHTEGLDVETSLGRLWGQQLARR